MNSSAVGRDILKKCESEIWMGRKIEGWDIQRQAPDLGMQAALNGGDYLSELPNTTFMLVIRQVSNGNNIVWFTNQLPWLYTDVSHWKELINSIDCNEGLQEPLLRLWCYRYTSGIIRDNSIIQIWTLDPYSWSITRIS